MEVEIEIDSEITEGKESEPETPVGTVQWEVCVHLAV